MKKGFICILTSLFIVTLVGCSGKDKQVTISTGEKAPIELQGKDVSNTTKVTSENIYKNEKLGFSLTFPDSWKGKYTIEEKDNGIWVRYKPKVKDQNSGDLFAILKDTKDLENQLTSVYKAPKFFKAKGITYYICESTGATFDNNHPEFQTYMKMYHERVEIIKTLKTI